MAATLLGSRRPSAWKIRDPAVIRQLLRAREIADLELNNGRWNGHHLESTIPLKAFRGMWFLFGRFNGMSWTPETNRVPAKIPSGAGFLVTCPVSALDQVSCGGRCPPACLR